MADKKLICAEDLRQAIWDDHSINGANFVKVRRHIEAAKAVEVKPVVHGRWEFVPSQKYGRHYTDAICTACKTVLDTHCDNDLEYRQEKIKKKLLYCPNCGADMRGDKDGK